MNKKELKNKGKKQFYDKSMYVIGNYIWAFFFGNFYFLMTGMLFFITMIAYGDSILSEGFLYMYISSLTLGPSVSALFNVMYKLTEEKEVRTTGEYFKSYASNFKQSFLLGAIINSLIFYILFDIKLFNLVGDSTITFIIFLITILFILNIAIYGFLLIIRFNMKLIDILKLSIVLAIKNYKNTIINSLLLVTMVLITNRFLFLWAICLFTLISYFIIINTKEIILEIENKSLKQEKIDVK